MTAWPYPFRGLPFFSTLSIPLPEALFSMRGNRQFRSKHDRCETGAPFRPTRTLGQVATVFRNAEILLGESLDARARSMRAAYAIRVSSRAGAQPRKPAVHSGILVRSASPAVCRGTVIGTSNRSVLFGADIMTIRGAELRNRGQQALAQPTATQLSVRHARRVNGDPWPEDRASLRRFRVPDRSSALRPSHSSSFDQRRRPEALRTAMATAFFWPTSTTSRLPRVTPV